MCGIAGVLGGEETTAEPMIRALTHRGPNGIRTESAAGAALAHARLSIIDLEGGWQPLHAAGGTVCGNGEIYNFVELAAEHGLSDVLTTGSDFEPLLHLYAREGETAFRRLRGMYALCLIGPDGRAFLARDPFGIKPLYIMEHGGGLAFASEPRAFFAAGMMQKVLDDGAEHCASLTTRCRRPTARSSLPSATSWAKHHALLCHPGSRERHGGAMLCMDAIGYPGPSIKRGEASQ